jgi:iron complex outermembrane recepter protein
LADKFEETDPIFKQVYKFKQYENIKSDEVISYELGYRYWNSDSFSFDVAAYYNQYSNNLVANNEFTDLFPEQSIRKSTTLGLEATMAWRPVVWGRFQISSSFMDMDITAKRKNDIVNNLISHDPRFQFAFRSSFDISPAVELDFWLRYNDSASGVLVTQAIPSYVSLDARLAWKPNKNLELAFIANNLNDSQHPEFYDGLTPNPLQAVRMFWLQGNLKF